MSGDVLCKIEAWNAAEPKKKIAAIQAVEEQLPDGISFGHIQKVSLANQGCDIALFEYDGCAFALVPGNSRAVLGYDRTDPWQPSEEHLDDWEIVMSEFGADCTIESYLDHYLTPFREVIISPMLVEVEARVCEYGQSGDNHTEMCERVEKSFKDGFRLPSCDEWEYLCAAGSRSLFRWGNKCPVSNSQDDESFILINQPNAFGLTFNKSTYDSELCQGSAFRGGDGGGSVCGGIGSVITWFPLASSFRVPQNEVDGWWVDAVFTRRILSIDFFQR